MKPVVFVDLDGTIAVSPISSVIKEAYGLIAASSKRSLEEVEALSWRIHIDLVKKAVPLAFDWDYIYARVSELLGIRVAFSIEKRFQELCGSSRLLDDAGEVLTKLRNLTKLTVLATNGLIKYQKCVIDSLGLDKYFDAAFTPDTRGCLKNRIEFYAVPGEHGNMIVVGDNYTFDVYYPKKFGLKAVHVLRSSRDPYVTWLGIDDTVRPDTVIKSLKHLPDVLPKL